MTNAVYSSLILLSHSLNVCPAFLGGCPIAPVLVTDCKDLDHKLWRRIHHVTTPKCWTCLGEAKVLAEIRTYTSYMLGLNVKPKAT